MRVSRISDIDAFVRDNIFLILQRRTRWIYEDGNNDSDRELFEKFVAYAFKSEKNWLKKTTKATRPKIKHDFDNAVRHWMERYYKKVTFTYTISITSLLSMTTMMSVPARGVVVRRA